MHDDDDDVEFDKLLEEQAAQRPDSRPRWLTRQDELRKNRQVDVHTSDINQAGSWHESSQRAADLLTAALAEESVSEVHANGCDTFFVVRDGKMGRLKAQFHSVEDYNGFLRMWVDGSETARTWDELVHQRRAVVKMSEGSSLTLVFPPIARTNNKGAQFVIRKHNLSTHPLEFYAESGTFSKAMLDYLTAAVRAKANVLIVGQMGAGKTSLMSALTDVYAEHERVILAEEVPEIGVRQPNVAYMQYQPNEPNMSLHDIFDVALYMRADRLIVGELHDVGITRTLKAFMRGTAGGMFTYHAGNIDQCMDRMAIDLLLENPNMQLPVTNRIIQQAVDVIVVLGRYYQEQPDGSLKRIYRCRQIAEVNWRTTDQGTLGRKIIFEYDFKEDKFRVKDGYDDGGKVATRAMEEGVPIDRGWFMDEHRARLLKEGLRDSPR